MWAAEAETGVMQLKVCTATSSSKRQEIIFSPRASRGSATQLTTTASDSHGFESAENTSVVFSHTVWSFVTAATGR